MSYGNPKHEIPIDLAKPFTLFEVCPSCTGTGKAPSAGPFGNMNPPGPCKVCNGDRGRPRTFDTLPALKDHVAKLSVCPECGSREVTDTDDNPAAEKHVHVVRLKCKKGHVWSPSEAKHGGR
jgi:rRNA maturation protein Nop10